MAYLKKVDDATNNPGAGPGDGWFKISEVGYDNREFPQPFPLRTSRANQIPFAYYQKCGASTSWYVQTTPRGHTAYFS